MLIFLLICCIVGEMLGYVGIHLLMIVHFAWGCCKIGKCSIFLQKSLFGSAALFFLHYFRNQFNLVLGWSQDLIFLRLVQILASKGAAFVNHFGKISCILQEKKLAAIRPQKLMTFGRLLGQRGDLPKCPDSAVHGEKFYSRPAPLAGCGESYGLRPLPPAPDHCSLIRLVILDSWEQSYLLFL